MQVITFERNKRSIRSWNSKQSLKRYFLRSCMCAFITEHVSRMIYFKGLFAERSYFGAVRWHMFCSAGFTALSISCQSNRDFFPMLLNKLCKISFLQKLRICVESMTLCSQSENAHGDRLNVSHVFVHKTLPVYCTAHTILKCSIRHICVKTFYHLLQNKISLSAVWLVLVRQTTYTWSSKRVFQCLNKALYSSGTFQILDYLSWCEQYYILLVERHRATFMKLAVRHSVYWLPCSAWFQSPQFN